MRSNGEAVAPLILTLALDERARERFDRLRRAHFPRERNLIPAHLTLFHHLPGEEESAIIADVEKACKRQGPLALTATAPLLLGRGVAYALDAPGLAAMHARLADGWRPWLRAQDRQPLRPHVTVQNKVRPEQARALYERLQGEFVPFEVAGEGLTLWRYLGGPWRLVGTYPFRG